MVKEHQQGVKLPKPEELEAEEPTQEEKVAARLAELCDTNTRRELEDIARGLGLDPTKTEYPDKFALAKAIAEKEIPAEVETEEPS